MLIVMICELVGLFDEVRLLNHRLVQVADELHADVDVSVPGRGVLEFLQRSGPTSVPDIARARYVSRQHIQSTIDALATNGLVTNRPNPAHRRSPLFSLTSAGASTIASMHDRERTLLEQRVSSIAAADVVAATQVLAAVRAALEAEEVR